MVVFQGLVMQLELRNVYYLEGGNLEKNPGNTGENQEQFYYKQYKNNELGNDPSYIDTRQAHTATCASLNDTTRQVHIH